MPMFLFGSYLSEGPLTMQTLWAFLILHLLVYPSSNGYNSYQDRDEGPIGGLEHPPEPNQLLGYLTIIMDIVALGLSVAISINFAILVLIYILFSRAYSWRKIRLKKYGILSYFIIALFQGSLVIMMAIVAGEGYFDVQNSVYYLGMLYAFLLLGGSYPITQIYQHEADRQDGVVSLSAMLGVKKTFLFSEIHVAAATIILYFLLPLGKFGVYLLLMLPILVYINWWKFGSAKKPELINFKNTMRLNLLASICLNTFFIYLLLSKLYGF